MNQVFSVILTEKIKKGYFVTTARALISNYLYRNFRKLKKENIKFYEASSNFGNFKFNYFAWALFLIQSSKQDTIS